MLASVTGLQPYRLYITFGDTHVYNNHIEAVQKQLQNEPMKFPRLGIAKKDSIDDIKAEDIMLIDYESHGAIKAPMAV
jgi:thymidylate synthase